MRLAARGIDARVYGVDIDTRSGALASRRTSTASAGGATAPRPARRNGAILLAGHVDSAKRGAGAFYALKNARRGDTVSVTSDDGKIRSYRVTTMQPRAQGRAAGEHLLAHAARAGSCSSPAAGRSTPPRATTATTSSSPRCRAERLRRGGGPPGVSRRPCVPGVMELRGIEPLTFRLPAERSPS